MKKKGYPPLFDYFSEKKKAGSKAIAFRYACYPLLEAALGKQNLQIIRQKEQTDKRVLLKKELEELLKDHPTSELTSANYQEVFFFGNVGKQASFAIDPDTKVPARIIVD